MKVNLSPSLIAVIEMALKTRLHTLKSAQGSTVLMTMVLDASDNLQEFRSLVSQAQHEIAMQELRAVRQDLLTIAQRPSLVN